MKIIKPPQEIPLTSQPTIFLAGSIEMGTAENWQTRVEKMLTNEDCVVFNPRRDDWDWTWKQSIDNPKFVEQVKWELDCLERADIIAMYFDPNTKSPISLLELGLFVRTDKDMIVCCPEGFWRKGNVDIVCRRYEQTRAANLDELVLKITEKLEILKRFKR